MNYYIPSKETIINSEHIIRAEFEPPKMIEDEFDEFSGRTRSYFREARLTLVLTELKQENYDGYEGKHLGTSSVSKCLVFRSLEAEYFWDALKREAYSLSVFPSKAE
jgi:hypothetical protein